VLGDVGPFAFAAVPLTSHGYQDALGHRLPSPSRAWCCSWCEILGIEEEIRVLCGESGTQNHW
jgi:hypothetical protein